MEIVKTHTGKIYIDTDRKLEFLTVGDYCEDSDRITCGNALIGRCKC